MVLGTLAAMAINEVRDQSEIARKEAAETQKNKEKE
jgi:hypothetical protein